MRNKKIYINNQETNYEVTSDGQVFNTKTGKELKGTIGRNEYRTVQLTIDGKPKSCMVHRLVAQAFCENPNGYDIVDHIDRNKQNNKAENLRWTTLKGNAENVDFKKTSSRTKFDGDFEGPDWSNKIPGYMINKNGIIVNIITMNILKGSQRNGYLRILDNQTGKYLSIHRLVWEAFNGPIPEDMVIDHIDGNRSNNALSNLRLVSQSDNMYNAQKLGHSGQVKISQYDAQGNYIATYNSIHLAAQAINGNEIAIRKAADRHGKSAGYFWIREDQDITIDEVLKITTAGKPKSSYLGVTQYTPTGELIAHYSSCKEAGRAVGCSDSTIRRAAAAQRIGVGYYWIIDDSDIDINNLIK